LNDEKQGALKRFLKIIRAGRWYVVYDKIRKKNAKGGRIHQLPAPPAVSGK
jgi:hypothetical protein